MIHKAFGINDVVNVRINCPPDDLQCSDAFVPVNGGPWLVTCTKPLLIRRNELLIPVTIIIYAIREFGPGVLYLVPRAFNAGFTGTRGYYGGGPSG
jgi:hypothetical protein